MGKTELWYIDERVKRLAYIFLTNRSDLEVTPLDTDGMDYLVQIRTESRLSGRMFGAQAKGMLALRKGAGEPTKGLVFRKPGGRTFVSEARFPVCGLLFVMQNDKAFYKWLKEPVINSRGQPRLSTRSTQGFEPLSPDTLDVVVARVNRWYDAFRQAEDLTAEDG